MSYIEVINPKNDWQHIHVHPNQGFCIKLNLPDKRATVEDWKVTCFSEVFVLTKNLVENDNTRAFYFDQIYDLTEWSKISSVQIAEVHISWWGRDRTECKSKVLYVILQGKNEEQRDTLTIINPSNTEVTMLPHQLLEVILYDRDVSNVCYTSIIDNIITSQTNLYITQIAKKTVKHTEYGHTLDILDNHYPLINRNVNLLPLNPKIKDSCLIKNDGQQRTYIATHFYFVLGQKCIDEIHKMANGVYQGVELSFYDNDNHLSIEFSLNVYFRVKGAVKSKVYNALNRHQKAMVESKHQHKTDLTAITLRKERYYKHNEVLINPLNSDNVNFIVGEENCLNVEMPLPYVYDDTISKNERWDYEVSSVFQLKLHYDPLDRLCIQPLDDRNPHTVNCIQRWIVASNIRNIKAGQNICFLGLLKIFCKHLVRYVSFYLIDVSNSYVYDKRQHLPTITKKYHNKVSITEETNNELEIDKMIYFTFKDLASMNSNNNNKKKK